MNTRILWVKTDIQHSPLQGWDLEKTVRLGCAELRPDTIFLRSTVVDGIEPEECYGWCVATISGDFLTNEYGKTSAANESDVNNYVGVPR